MIRPAKEKEKGGMKSGRSENECRKREWRERKEKRKRWRQRWGTTEQKQVGGGVEVKG